MMISLLLAAAAAATQAAPATPAFKPTVEDRARAALAAAGMSSAGIDTLISVDKKHGPALREIMARGRQAEIAAQQALLKRPVDVEAFATANMARAQAAGELQREGSAVGIEQLRALSPADRVILASKMTSKPDPAKAAKPAAPAAKR